MVRHVCLESEPGADRIGDADEHDRDLPRRLLGRDGRRRAGRDDHAGPQSNKLRGELRQALWSSARETILYGNVLSLDIPGLGQPLPEGLDLRIWAARPVE